MQQPFPLQSFLLTVDAAEGVHQKRRAQEIHPPEMRRVNAVGNADNQIR